MRQFVAREARAQSEHVTRGCPPEKGIKVHQRELRETRRLQLRPSREVRTKNKVTRDIRVIIGQINLFAHFLKNHLCTALLAIDIHDGLHLLTSPPLLSVFK